jgi:hypothetical protein
MYLHLIFLFAAWAACLGLLIVSILFLSRARMRLEIGLVASKAAPDPKISRQVMKRLMRPSIHGWFSGIAASCFGLSGCIAWSMHLLEIEVGWPMILYLGIASTLLALHFTHPERVDASIV